MWYVKGVFLSTYTKKACVLKEIGLHAHIMLTILGSLVNMIGGVGRGLYDQLMSWRIFTLIMNKIFIRALNFTRQMAMGTVWIW